MKNKKINMLEEFILESVTLKRTCKDFAEERVTTLHANLDHVLEFLTFADASYNIENEYSYIEMCNEKWEKQKTFDFSIFENTTGKYIGSVSVMVKSINRSEYEFGYWLVKDAQGKGYMSQIVNALTKYLQEEIKANRVLIRCNNRNLNSAGVALRNGFLFEGRLFCADRADDAFTFVKLKDQEKAKELESIQKQLKEIFKLT